MNKAEKPLKTKGAESHTPMMLEKGPIISRGYTRDDGPDGLAVLAKVLVRPEPLRWVRCWFRRNAR